MKTKTGCLIVSLWMGILTAQGAPDRSVAVTIYNDNFAVIRDTRPLELTRGINTIRFTEVAATIDPTSVSFACLEQPDRVRILEQNYEYDLVSTDSLLKRYLDRQVRVWVKGSGQGNPNLVSGTLNAAVGSDLIIQKPDGSLDIISRGNVERIMLAERPDDLVIRPTLVWLANSRTAGALPCQITYTASGLKWHADYTAIIADDEKSIDLSGWVTIDNRSGTAYRDAKIKLIAGDVRRVQPPRPVRRMAVPESVMLGAVADDAGFQEKTFMDYHMYTLGRTSTLNNNQTKQIEFIEPVHGIAVEKRYIYETSIDPWLARNQKNKVKVVFELENSEANRLGIALPKGKVRTFKKDRDDDALEFVGEDTIDHTPRNEQLKLYIGDAFDIVAEHKSKDQKSRAGWRQTTREITVKNRKEDPVIVCVDEKFVRGRSWQIGGNNMSYEKTDAWTARFTVRLKPNEEQTVKFVVTETW